MYTCSCALLLSGGAWIFKRWCEKRIGRPPALPPLSLPPLSLPPPLPLPRPFPSPVPPLFLIRYSPSLFRPSPVPPCPLLPLSLPSPFPCPFPSPLSLPSHPFPSLPGGLGAEPPVAGVRGYHPRKNFEIPDACRSVLGHFRALKCLHCKASFILNKTDFYFLHSTS